MKKHLMLLCIFVLGVCLTYDAEAETLFPSYIYTEESPEPLMVGVTMDVISVIIDNDQVQQDDEVLYIPDPIIEPVVEEIIEPVIHDEHDVELLARVIYQEAGGNASCDECRRRVADVVLNRVNDPRFPNTIEEVLTQHRQYGRYSKTGVIWATRSNSEIEQDAVERAYAIAREVISGSHSDLYGQGYIWQAEFKQGKAIVYCCGTYFGK